MCQNDPEDEFEGGIFDQSVPILQWRDLDQTLFRMTYQSAKRVQVVGRELRFVLPFMYAVSGCNATSRIRKDAVL